MSVLGWLHPLISFFNNQAGEVSAGLSPASPAVGEPVGMGTHVVCQPLPLLNAAKGESLINHEGTS